MEKWVDSAAKPSQVSCVAEQCWGWGFFFVLITLRSWWNALCYQLCYDASWDDWPRLIHQTQSDGCIISSCWLVCLLPSFTALRPKGQVTPRSCPQPPKKINLMWWQFFFTIWGLMCAWEKKLGCKNWKQRVWRSSDFSKCQTIPLKGPRFKRLYSQNTTEIKSNIHNYVFICV